MRIYRRWHSVEKRRVFIRGNGKIQTAKRTDQLHEEDPSFIKKQRRQTNGAVSEQLGIYGSPSIAEESLVARDCMIALHSGADVVMQHISSGRSVDIIRHFKSLGANIHTEATPHHFTLTDEAVLTYGTLAKMNPPLRSEADRQAIIAGLADGTIDIIATDHAPHSKEEKRTLHHCRSKRNHRFGNITGARDHFSCTQRASVTYAASRKMTINPARLYHLDGGKIEKGAPADLVIFDPEAKWIPEFFASMSSNSPFIGWELYGKVKMTVCGGEIVYTAI